MINKYYRTKTVNTFDMSKETIRNPLIGFAPRAEDSAAVAECTLVYIDITLREIEPVEGSFNFDFIEKENQFSRWRKDGRHAVVRVISDYPGPKKHMDIPDWLFEKTGRDGTFYDTPYGKGYAPDYSNPIFIKEHRRMIEALGKRYGTDTFVSYVQLGSLGHWGEWHVSQEGNIPCIPLEEIRERYIEPYRLAFPNAKILMRRPFKAARANNFGLYNDMVGHYSSSSQWMGWIKDGGIYDQTLEAAALVSMAGFWKTAPVGGEFTSALPMSNLLSVNLPDTLNMLKESHLSFLGPNIPLVHEEKDERVKTGIQDVLRTLGYRIGVTKSVWSESHTARVKVTLTWENQGIAPMYWDWPVFLYFLDHNQRILNTYPVTLLLTDLVPGKKLKSVTQFEQHNLLKKTASVYIGIHDPMSGQPAIHLVSTQEKLGTLALVMRLDK